jgi:hypothetical protein
MPRKSTHDPIVAHTLKPYSEPKKSTPPTTFDEANKQLEVEWQPVEKAEKP